MQKARTMSHSVPRGPDLFAAVANRRDALVRAAREGRPPVAVVSDAAVELLGQKEAAKIIVRQFLGTCVRAVLDAENFVVANPKVRIVGDPLFKTGATYRETGPAKPAFDLLERFVTILDDNEAQRALELLQQRFDQR